MTRCLSKQDNPRAVWGRSGGADRVETREKAAGPLLCSSDLDFGSDPWHYDPWHSEPWLRPNSAGQRFWVFTLSVFPWVAQLILSSCLNASLVPCLAGMGNQRTLGNKQ